MTKHACEYAPSGYLSITVWEGSTTHNYRSWEDYYADGWPPTNEDEDGGEQWDDPEPSGSGWVNWYQEWRNMTDGPSLPLVSVTPVRRPRF